LKTIAAVMGSILILLSALILWRLDYVRQMIRHTQHCLSLGGSDALMFATKKEASKAYERAKGNGH
jgi:hypothetical protein